MSVSLAENTDSGVAVFGGTFDPVHFGHLRSAIEVREALQVETLKLVPAFIPPHRKAPTATAEQRLAMLRLATSDSAYIEVDDREINRGGKSFTVDTLASIREEIGSSKPLSLIVGADAYVLLDEWVKWQTLTDFAHLVILERPGHSVGQISERLESWSRDKHVAEPRCLGSQPAGLICQMRLTPLEISATMIRNLISRGESVEYLMPNAVIEYIQQHDLYDLKGHRVNPEG